MSITRKKKVQEKKMAKKRAKDTNLAEIKTNIYQANPNSQTRCLLYKVGK